ETLRAGASILQPLGASAWSPLYGMLTDRFGVTWVLDVMVA
ncbi:MAG: VOC family protein, partial [Methylobacterium sp.]